MTATLADDSRTVLLPAGFLALGTFAIGTEGFMIAPLLPVMAKDFALPVPTIALLVIVFTLVLVVIALSGSIWIMYHLDHNMMPMSTHDMRNMP